MSAPYRDDRARSEEEYRGLKWAVGRIAEHPDFPGKRDALNACVWDIVERSRAGRLSPLQRTELLTILRGRPTPRRLPVEPARN